MRFFENWGGFIWEYNSFGDYLKALVGRLLGVVIAIGILFMTGIALIIISILAFCGVV